MNTQDIEHIMIDGAALIQKEIQGSLESNPYCARVIKQQWPREQGYYISQRKLKIWPGPQGPSIGTVINTIHLQKSAINSPDICLSDLKAEWQTRDVTEHITTLLKHNAEWAWSTRFREDIVSHIDRRLVVQGDRPYLLPGAEIIKEKRPRKVNFWGRQVYPYISGGSKTTINPKYKKAAEQVIGFHPDIVHFLFPNLENWAGEIVWRNIEDGRLDPVGFYRVIMAYAAKPIRSDFGYVVTMLPRGLKGWLWKWAWKLVGFAP